MCFCIHTQNKMHSVTRLLFKYLAPFSHQTPYLSVSKAAVHPQERRERQRGQVLDNDSEGEARWRKKKWCREEECDRKPKQLFPCVFTCPCCALLASTHLDWKPPGDWWSHLALTAVTLRVCGDMGIFAICSCFCVASCCGWKGTYNPLKVFVYVCVCG